MSDQQLPPILSREQAVQVFADLLCAAFAEGFAASAEGWNGEMVPDFQQDKYFRDAQRRAVDKITLAALAKFPKPDA